MFYFNFLFKKNKKFPKKYFISYKSSQIHPSNFLSAIYEFSLTNYYCQHYYSYSYYFFTNRTHFHTHLACFYLYYYQLHNRNCHSYVASSSSVPTTYLAQFYISSQYYSPFSRSYSSSNSAKQLIKYSIFEYGDAICYQ